MTSQDAEDKLRAELTISRMRHVITQAFKIVDNHIDGELEGLKCGDLLWHLLGSEVAEGQDDYSTDPPIYKSADEMRLWHTEKYRELNNRF